MDRLLGVVIIAVMLSVIGVSWRNRMRARRKKRSRWELAALLAFVVTLTATYRLLRAYDVAPAVPFVGGSIAASAAYLLVRYLVPHG